MRHARLAVVLPLALALLTGCGDDAPADSDAVSPASAAASSAPVSDSPVVVAVAEDDGKDAQTAAIRVGQLVQLDLATCGGCGFEWTVDTAPDAAVAVEETVPQPEPSVDPTAMPLPGTPTVTRLAFKGTAAGTTKVSVGYHGPASSAPDRTVVLTITVS